VDAQAAGHEGRDLLQSARAELARAQRAAGCATVAPLLDERRQAALDALTRRTESASRGWLVRSAWYEERMASWAGRYRTEVAAACARPPGVEGASAEGAR
jgi:hypothetical protein